MIYKDIKEKIVSYLRDIQSEGKKVVWPNRAYVIAATIIIFVIVILVALFVLFTDFCFAKFFSYIGRVGRY